MGQRWERIKGSVRGTDAPPAILIIILAFILYLLDMLYGFDGFNFSDVMSTPWKVVTAIHLNLFLFVNIFLFFMRPAGSRVLVSRFVLSAVFIDIFVMGGFNGAGMFHFIIPLLIYLLWARNVYQDEANANMVIAMLWAVDYFGYGAMQHLMINASWSTPKLMEMLSNRLIIPVWGYYAIFSAYQYEKDILSTILAVILLGVSIFYLVDDGTAIVAHMGKLSPEYKYGFWEYWTQGWTRFRDTIVTLPQRWNQGVQTQLEYATGGYYRGQVEEMADEPIGVFLQNIVPSQKKYHPDEPVILWADLKAKTLKDSIGVTLNCSSKEIKGEVTPDYYLDKSIHLNISTMQEESVECKFKSLEPGTHSISLFANFNFETMSYLKTYFMDIGRIRALRSDGIDPLDQYSVKEKNPVAVYTNGPVKLAVGTNDQLPIGLGKDYIQKPYLGITIENLWNGKITEIKDLVIQVPRDMHLSQTEEGICNGWFIEVQNEDLDEALQNEDYRAYQITGAGLSTFEFPIDNFESLRCTIDIDPEDISSVLGTTPLATHYYQADAKYNYAIEEKVTVRVQKSADDSALI